jgi:FAD synthase
MKWIDPFLNIYDYLEFSDGASKIGEEYEESFPVCTANVPPKPDNLVVKRGEYYGTLKGNAKERINATRKYFETFLPKTGSKVSALYYDDNKYYE